MTQSKQYDFRPPIASAEVQVTKAAAIAIAGASGSGKTESAMRLARGYCGPGEKFCVIDTEEKRALYKKARHQPWDWLDFQPPFTPERTAAILDSVKHYKAVILDSASHEYAGEGGIAEIQEDTLEKMAKGDPYKLDKLSAPAWKDAKRRHKRVFMSALIRYPTLLICCLRAEPKVKFVKVEKDGRMTTQIVDAGFQPICEKNFMFEMLASFMMYAENAGVPEQVKALEDDLKPVFLLGQQIDEATGARLAAWANSGGMARVEAAAVAKAMADANSIAKTVAPAGVLRTVSANELATLREKCRAAGVPEADLCERGEIARLEDFPRTLYEQAVRWLDKKAAAKPEAITDEAVALSRIERAQDEGEAAAVLQLCQGQTFHANVVSAYNARFA